MSVNQVVCFDISAKIDRTDPLAFLNAVYEAYEKAEATSGGSVDRFYRIGGFTIRLRFAGPELLPYITPALAHLITEPVPNPGLTVCLWDSASTKTMMLPPPWQRQHYLRRGEIYGFTNERIHTTFQRGANALSVLDTDRNLGVYWVNTSEQIPYWETSAPLRAIFHTWMGKQGIQLVHAGAVGLPNGGVLVVGKGGSGKSTTALACLNSELSYASDDYCLLAFDPTPNVFSIYCSGKRNADDLQRLPFLNAVTSNRPHLDTEKALYFLHEHFPEKLLPSFPLRAILIPRITREIDTTLQATSSTAALTALVPSTIMQLPESGKEACQIMMKIVKQVPCYYLSLGTDLRQIPEIISDILSKNQQWN